MREAFVSARLPSDCGLQSMFLKETFLPGVAAPVVCQSSSSSGLAAIMSSSRCIASGLLNVNSSSFGRAARTALACKEATQRL